MKTTQEMIEVMQAYANGATIEYAYAGTNKWGYGAKPIWDWVGMDYRVRVEPKIPRDFWLVGAPKQGNDCCEVFTYKPTLFGQGAEKCFTNGVIIHVREVIEE